jgi:Fe-S cluster assembly ATPase SufC
LNFSGFYNVGAVVENNFPILREVNLAILDIPLSVLVGSNTGNQKSRLDPLCTSQ